MTRSEKLGHAPIGKLLLEQAVPASIGILVMSIYMIVDTIFVGQFIGAVAIGAITVVLPITFLISSTGMAIGIGGSSMVSRALGEEDHLRAKKIFGNQITLTFLLSLTFLAIGYFFQESILNLFGGKGDILPYASTYFLIILIGVPFLAWAMMTNSVIRAEGAPKVAMFTMLIPAILNLILDPIFIIWLEWGIAGAAWATTISYIASALFTFWYFFSGRSEMTPKISDLGLNFSIITEIFSLGGVTLARQGVISILAIVLNNTLFSFGGELAVSVYGIIQRVSMFANFPVLGITQGFLPIAGFNYGAANWNRVKSVVKLAIKVGTIIAVSLFVMIIIFAEQLAGLFTTDPNLIAMTVPAIRISFMATPLVLMQLIGSAYFQAIGKAVPALFLTLTKQGFCLIPLILLLPQFYELTGVWIAFPIADILSAGICFSYLRNALRKLPQV